MIDRQNGKLVFECDLCSATFEPGIGDFDEALAVAKAEGWTAKRFGLGADTFWTNHCAACQGEA